MVPGIIKVWNRWNKSPEPKTSSEVSAVIRNENVKVGMVVAIGTDPSVPELAQGRMALVNNITWPAREGRGRRNYQAEVAMADGTSAMVDVKYLSGIQYEPGLGALANQAQVGDPENLTEASEPEVVVVTAIEEVGEPVEVGGEPEVEVEVIDQVQENKKARGKRAQA